MAVGKTLCEILTTANVMSLPVVSPRVDGNLSGTVLCGHLFNEEATTPEVAVTARLSCRQGDGKTDTATQAEKQVLHETMSARILACRVV